MTPAAAARNAVASLAALFAVPALHAESARETVYFTTPNNTISRALLGSGTAQPAVTDGGTNLKGLAARYDGNDLVTLLAANSTQGGGVRAYSCPSPTGACTALGPVATLKYAVAVALDTSGNAYSVNKLTKAAPTSSSTCPATWPARPARPRRAACPAATAPLG